jgi:hypothetical protein
MTFSNVKLLSYNHRNNFFSESGIRYNSVVEFSINGYVLDLSRTIGAGSIFQACKLLSDSIGSYSDIIIDGINYGYGKIKSVSFDSGNWVRVTEYNIDVEILKSSDFDFQLDPEEKNLTSEILSGLKTYAEFLEDFSESYSVDYTSDQNEISGSHNIDIKVSPLFQGNKIEFAKNLATFIFSKASISDLSKYSYSLPDPFRRKETYSETYDIIGLSFGFRKNFSFLNSSECHSLNRSMNVSFSEDGLITVTENTLITGKCRETDEYSTIKSAKNVFNSEVGGSYGRCNEIFLIYKNAQSDPLIDKEIERSVKINNFSGEIEYTVSYTNDKRKKNNYSYEYSLEISRSEDGIWNASEQGAVIGDGTRGQASKFENAWAGWNIEKNNISQRINDFYIASADPKPSPVQALKLIEKNTTHSIYEGSFNYSYSFTDDKTINLSSDIRRSTISISDNKGTKIHNDFIVPGGSAKYVIAQLVNQSAQSERSVEGELEISKVPPFNGFSYFTNAFNLSEANKGSGSDMYLSDFSFSSDEIEQNISFRGSYKYSAQPVT